MSRRVVLILLAGGVIVIVVAALAGSLMAVLGAELPCAESSGGTLGVSPTRAALSEIPADRIALYREAGKRYEVNWTFLASIGTQECSTGTCGHVYPSGCGGPMQIAIERESACSPGPGPTIWERYGVDANGGGHPDPFNLADAIFTAARMMRPVFGLAGQTYADYHQAACNYYGACADAVAAYAAEVMARAVRYGFRAPGTPGGGAAEPAGVVQASSCGAAAYTGGGASASQIVRIAQSQLGQAESPSGSNCNPYGPCEEWCALFASWVWERAGVPLPGGTTPYAWTGSLYEWAAAQDVLGGSSSLLESATASAHVLAPSDKPAPGDLIFFGSAPKPNPGEHENLSFAEQVLTYGASDHVAIVERVFPNGEITTIDGNYGDRVARVGPFLPAEATAGGGEPAPVYGYAVPPAGAGSGK